MTNLGDRIIVLIDMDCFFCQVESRLQPNLQGKPVAVVQYNQWRSGGIIAVNYEARDFGVTRHMRGDEAKEKCPDIALVSVPSLRGKADTSKYRSAGREVVDVLKKHCSIIERASVDEAYLDITELVEKRIASLPYSQSNLISSLSNSFVVGYCDDESNDEEQRRDGVERWIAEGFDDLGDTQSRKLAVAGVIVEELRSEIYQITKFRCSAGISYNKILSKLACGLHKPNRQTILPAAAVPTLYSTLPVKKVRNLGGKFGNIVMESLGCNVMSDLMRYSLQDLQKRFDEKTGSWLHNIAKGIDHEPVTNRLVCKSIGSSKNFPGKQAIVKLDVLNHWVGELSADVSDRLEQDLEENERRATTLTVSFQYYDDRKLISQSRSCPLKYYKADKIASQSINMITKSTQKPIANIGISAGKFVQAKGSGNFVNFFKNNGPSTTDETSIGETPEIVNEPSELCPTINEPAAIDRECEDLDELSSTVPNRETENQKAPKSPFESFFAKRSQREVVDTNNDEPISPSTAILGSARCRRALNRTNIQNSFFLNFLKDAKQELAAELESASHSCPQDEIPGSNRSNSVDSPEKQAGSHESNDRKPPDEKAASEIDLLAQLQEIFPDLDNIDRNVVQLLPMELQRIANSYLKTKVTPKVQPVKNVAKSKSKSSKTQKKNSTTTNSFDNFFVKASSNVNADSSLRKCNDCNRMIRIDKYEEHKDFHVAEDLHKVINQSEARETTDSPAKSAAINLASESNLLKRKLSAVSPKPKKKIKTISSFFGA